MSENITKLLATCLDHIENDTWTVEQALDQFPSHREELEPLLRLTNKMEPLKKLAPRPEFAKNARLRLENLLPNSPKSVTSASQFRHKQRKSILFGKRRFVMTWLITIFTAFSLLAGGTGVAYASSDSLPGDFLYSVKRGIEDVRLGFTGDDNKMDLMLEFSETRLNEMNALLAGNRYDDLNEAMENFQVGVQELVEYKNRISNEDSPKGEAQNLRIEQQLKTHAEIAEKLQVQLKTQEQNKEQDGELLQEKEQIQENKPEDAPGGPSDNSPGQNNQGEEPGSGNPDAPQGDGTSPGGSGDSGSGQGGQNGQNGN